MFGALTWERDLFIVIQGLHRPWLDEVMLFFSGPVVWFPLILWPAAKIFRRYGKRDLGLLTLLLVMLVAVVDSSTSYFFKNMFQRLRPCKMDDLRVFIPDFDQGCGGRWGFFSSHSANAASIVFFLGAFARTSRLEWFSLGLLVVLIGLSRIYLGVHLPLDVIAGFAWGTLVASAWRYFARHSLTAPADA